MGLRHVVAFNMALIYEAAHIWQVERSSVIVRLSFRRNLDDAGEVMGFISLLPREDQYFDLFTQMTLYISAAARELKEMLLSAPRAAGGLKERPANKTPGYADYARRIKGLEHACDELTHTISTRLNKSFLTPFDREDSHLMSGALDDIVDLL